MSVIEIAKVCPECGFPIHGKAGKVFCTDTCRNRYNNRSKNAENSSVRKINQVLKMNRRILEEFLVRGQKTAHRDSLLERGFNFTYHTEIEKTAEGELSYYCYDFGYVSYTENEIGILVREV